MNAILNSLLLGQLLPPYFPLDHVIRVIISIKLRACQDLSERSFDTCTYVGMVILACIFWPRLLSALLRFKSMMTKNIVCTDQVIYFHEFSPLVS